MFEAFIAATGYVTEAEQFGWSFVFHYFLSEKTKQRSQLIPNMSWWYAVARADWRHPEGPDSSIEQRMDHPVVQVSRNDALAFCRWADKRLPTEAEWEIAAKGGTENDFYPWGTDFFSWRRLSLQHLARRVSQSKYEGRRLLRVLHLLGFMSRMAMDFIKSLAMWEWCSNPARIPLEQFRSWDSHFFEQRFQQVDDAMYATRGGSFLCHESYCKRYRIAARNGNSGMSAANNLGFRCAKS